MTIGHRLIGELGPIRIINLPYRTDRRAQIRAELAGMGLSLGDGDVQLFPAFRPRKMGGFSSIGARGCFLSHLGVLRQAMSENTPSVLILEDDACFPRKAREMLPMVLDGLARTQWSIFYGGYRIDGVLEQKQPGAVPVPPQLGLITAHCIALRRAAIERIVPYLEAMLARAPGSPDGGPMHVDGAYSWFRRANPDLVTLAAVPQVAHQRASRTDIHRLRLFDRMPVVRDIAQGLRYLRQNPKWSPDG